MKRSPLYRLLLALAVILVIGIVLETRDDTGLSSTDDDGASEVTTPIATVSVSNGAKAEKWASTILDRPLFRMDRRPATGDAAAAGPTTGAPSGMPRLAGIIMTSGIRLAVFQSGGAIKPLVVREGGAVGPYTVESIRPTLVLLRGLEGTSVLKPRPDNAETNQPSSDASGAPAPGPVVPAQDAAPPPPDTPGPPDVSGPATYNPGPLPSFEGSNPEVPRYRSPPPPSISSPPPNVP
jgi:hypothetical protein